VRTLPLPLGCIDLTLTPIAGDMVRARWTDAITAEVVEADATLDELAKWERDECPPDTLAQRRLPLDTAIAAAKARLEGSTMRRDQMRECFPGIEYGEWF
jgi:hypothetical protein